MLRKIQSASNKEKATESVKWYNVANVNSMSPSDVTFNTIGFTGTLTANKTFTFYLDDEKTGAKSYNIYVKNLSGNFTLTLTTGRSGKTNYVLKGGVNLTGRILVDDEGNITSQSVTATSVIESGNNQPATSEGAYKADNAISGYARVKNLNSVGWYKIITGGRRNETFNLDLNLCQLYNNKQPQTNKISIEYSWLTATVVEIASSGAGLNSEKIDKIAIAYNGNNSDSMAIYVHYNTTSFNAVYFNFNSCAYEGFLSQDFIAENPSDAYENVIEIPLHTNGVYVNGQTSLLALPTPTSDGTYNLQCTMTNGVPSYSWV
jgi:hypothetical protein